MTIIQDRMIYLPVVRAKNGKTIVAERDTADMDRLATIGDIADGQIEDLVQVLECNPVEGTCRDVTEDIARSVMHLWASQGEPLRDWQREFIELHISIQAANSFAREAA
ncbi:MAG: hypothetical protein JWR80_10029 [Bradyrhizobium sp.]|nr:hypothetical protein [Bradyrhizobium sp.]